MGNMSDIVDVTTGTAIAAVGASFKTNAAAIITLTTTGETAWLMSSFHPKSPIIMVTRNAHTSRIGHLYNNIFPLEYRKPRLEKWTGDVDARLDFAIAKGREIGFIKTGSFVIFVSGYQPGSCSTNSMRILKVEENQVVGKPH